MFQNDPDNCFNDFMSGYTDAPVDSVRDDAPETAIESDVWGGPYFVKNARLW